MKVSVVVVDVAVESLQTLDLVPTTANIMLMFQTITSGRTVYLIQNQMHLNSATLAAIEAIVMDSKDKDPTLNFNPLAAVMVDMVTRWVSILLEVLAKITVDMEATEVVPTSYHGAGGTRLTNRILICCLHLFFI